MNPDPDSNPESEMDETLKNIKGSSGSSQTDSAIDMMDEEGYIGKAFYDIIFLLQFPAHCHMHLLASG